MKGGDKKLKQYINFNIHKNTCPHQISQTTG